MKKRLKILFSVFFPITCLVLTGSLFFALLFPKQNNVASAVNIPTKGGAIYVGESSILTMNNSTLSSYGSSGEGGAIYIDEQGALDADNLTLSDNSSYRGGGGIYVADNGSIMMYNSLIENNTAYYQGGGGIYLSSNNVANIYTSSIINNISTANDTNIGGGIYAICKAKITLNNTEIYGNKASSFGGVYIGYGSSLTMNGTDHCYVRNNTATGSETANTGGIFVGTDSVFTMTGGYIGENTCSANIYASDMYISSLGAVVNLNGGSIDGNVYALSNVNMTNAFDSTQTRFTLGKNIKILYSGDTATPKLKIRLSDESLTALANGTTISILELVGNSTVAPTTSNITVENMPDYCQLSYSKNSSGNYEVKVDFKYYTITLNANGGTVLGSSTTSASYQYNVIFGYIPTPTRTGYTFDGWWTSETGGTKYTASSKNPFKTATTLYAHWTANTYTIYLNLDGGTGTDTLYYKYDTGLYTDSACTASIPIFPIPTKTGYKFSCFYTYLSSGQYLEACSSSGNPNITNLNQACVDGATALKTHYNAKTWTVTVDHNYAETDASHSTLYIMYNTGVYSSSAYSSSTKITSITAPTKTGYTFNGYYFGNTQIIDSSGSMTSSATLTDFAITSPKIVAKWTLQTNVKVINETKKTTYKTRTLTTSERNVGGIYSPLRDAIDAASSGDVLRIVANITESYTKGTLTGAPEYENISASKNLTILGSEYNNIEISVRGSIYCPSYSLTIGGSNTKNLTIDFSGSTEYSKVGAKALKLYSGVNINGYINQTSTVSASSFYMYGGAINGRASSDSSYFGRAVVEIANGSDFYFQGGTIYGYINMNNTSSTISYLNLASGTIVNKPTSSTSASVSSGVIASANSYFRLLAQNVVFNVNGTDLYVAAKPKKIRLYYISTQLLIGVYSYATNVNDIYFEIDSNTSFSGNGHIDITTFDTDQISGYAGYYYIATVPTQDIYTNAINYISILDYDDIVIGEGTGSHYYDSTNKYWRADESCFDINSDILVWDDKKKRIVRKKAKDIKYTDKLLVWNFDKGCLDFAEPLFIQKHTTVSSYDEIKFSDGTIWKVAGEHSVFSVDHNDFRAIVSSNPEYGCPIGTRVINSDGKILTIISKRKVYKPLTHTNIFTNYHMNIYINGILSSAPMNNMYEIKDMKFIKKGEHVTDLNLLEGIEEKYIKGMRLEEYTDEKIKAILRYNPTCATLKEFIDKKASLNK